jgi:hypothetical protein
VKTFSCWNQFLCLAFGQLTFRESLRDVETCLRSRHDQLYHLGIRGAVSRSVLADANRERDWRIYHDLARRLIRRARALYARDPIGVELNETIYALDSTTIDLCPSLFPWARFRRAKAAIKLHPLLDLRGSIPTFISISQGKQADVRVLDELVLEPGACYVMERGYVDFQRLYGFVLAAAFFVTRAKSNLQFNRLESRPVEASTGVRSDQIIWRRNPSKHPTLPGQTAAHPLRGRGDRQEPGLSDEQLHAPGPDYRLALQGPLEGGVVLQMDQAAPADQTLLRHQRQRGENPDLDFHLCLRVGRDCEKATGVREESLQHFADFERQRIFARVSASNTYGFRPPDFGRQPL